MPNFGSNDPQDFGWSYPVTPVPFTWRGHEFAGGVHPLAAARFAVALDRLASAPGFRLRPGPPAASGCWGYEDRSIRGGTARSFHAWGLAIDVNAPDNPQGVALPAPSPYRMPQLTDQIVRPLGILWGGAHEFDARPDWMHLEIHLSPTEIGDRGGLGLPGKVDQRFPLPQGCYYGPFSGPDESISGFPASDATYRLGLAWAQNKLGIAPDGRYGPQTRAALVKWQSGHPPLATDGLLGPLTWASLWARK